MYKKNLNTLHRFKKTGFTLIEMIVALTILSIIMLSIFVVYSNFINLNKKLELSRILQENSRNIIESIAYEIREKGIDYSAYSLPGFETIDYNGIGNKQLYIKNTGASPIIYCMMKKGVTGVCESSCVTSPELCYLGKKDSNIELNDERVNIKNLNFFISGKPNSSITNIDKEGKVTIIFDLGIANGKGLNSNLLKASEIHIQTTISAKLYKNMTN
ncbi:MAG: type II secretion system protein [Candidatus Gracilibacteria bacterium]|nr:type II secretion system protein [Candidatus Gracilibacteria bacterium]MDD2908304.1 type II secretion system protein [Candidatus Gracilibacteria bacterium]